MTRGTVGRLVDSDLLVVTEAGFVFADPDGVSVALGERLAVMKRMIRPMVWTMLVTIPIFLWLSWLTVNPAAAITPAAQILPFAGRVVWTARLVGPMQVRMVWYFVCSVLSGAIGKRAAGHVKPVITG